MRLLYTLVVLLLTQSISYAAQTVKIGFRAFGNTTSVTCTVFGTSMLPHNNSGTYVQVNTPDADYSRTYNLGRAGMANYSTVGVKAVTWKCVNTGTKTEGGVKVFLNGLEAHALTVSEGSFGVKR